MSLLRINFDYSDVDALNMENSIKHRSFSDVLYVFVTTDDYVHLKGEILNQVWESIKNAVSQWRKKLAVLLNITYEPGLSSFGSHLIFENCTWSSPSMLAIPWFPLTDAKCMIPWFQCLLDRTERRLMPRRFVQTT